MFWADHMAYGILVPDQGWNLWPPAVGVLGLSQWPAMKVPRKDFYQKNSGLFNVCVCSLTQSCPTLCGPMDCSPPGSSVHGIFQARILEWIATAHSRNLPNPVIEPASLASPDLESGFFTTSATWEAQSLFNGHALMYLTLEYTVLESKNYLKGLESEL